MNHDYSDAFKEVDKKIFHIYSKLILSNLFSIKFLDDESLLKSLMNDLLDVDIKIISELMNLLQRPNRIVRVSLCITPHLYSSKNKYVFVRLEQMFSTTTRFKGAIHLKYDITDGFIWHFTSQFIADNNIASCK